MSDRKLCVGKEKRSFLEDDQFQKVEITIYKHYVHFCGIKLFSVGKSYGIYFPESEQEFLGFIPEKYRKLCKEVGKLY